MNFRKMSDRGHCHRHVSHCHIGKAWMQQQTYRRYAVWRHAIAHQEGLLLPDGYTELEAQDASIFWAPAWVDNHG